MRKFAARYPIEGTSALRLEAAEPGMKSAAIIAFPDLHQGVRLPNRVAQSCTMYSTGFESTGHRAFKSELVAELCTGNAAGKPFDRMKPWQAAIGGFALFATACAGLFLAL